MGFLYASEMTDGRGPLEGLRRGAGCQRSQDMIRWLELSALPPDFQGEEGSWRLDFITSYQ